jgi:hypothetical protein
LSGLTIDADKAWASKNITGMGSITPDAVSGTRNLGSASVYWNAVNAAYFTLQAPYGGTYGLADFNTGKLRLPVGSNRY